MSQANLLCHANTPFHHAPRTFANAGAKECRSAAERLLKEAAYVCHLTRTVRVSIIGRQEGSGS
jgi:hypothetical protein